jgi:hypothetical protein
MNNPYYYSLVEYNQLNSNNENLQIRIYRSFKLTKDYDFNYLSKKRKKYGEFNLITAIKIFKHYIELVNKSKIFKKLRAINKLYDYIFIFIVDIFKEIPTIIINLYKSAIAIVLSLNDFDDFDDFEYDFNHDFEYNQNKKIKLMNLKKYTQKKVIKMINILNTIFEDSNILIRLPYNLLITVKKIDIFDIFAKYNGIWLDTQVSNYLNNKYKIEIILLLSKLSKKIDNYIILYILQFLMLKGENIYDLDKFYLDNTSIANTIIADIEYVSVGSNLFIIV